MKTIIVSSLRQNAGKTSVIIGLSKALQKKIGYIKPFGDRLIYRKKRLWDYDTALVYSVFGIKKDPADMSIGFDHSRLLYAYDSETTKNKVIELLASAGNNNDIMFVEGGREISYGASVYLDAISLAKSLNGELLVVISGKEDTIIDDIHFLHKYVDLSEVNFKGIIINKVERLEDFNDIHLPKIKQLPMNILGVFPYHEELAQFTVHFLADRLFARIVTGESFLNRPVKSIIIGSMSANAALKSPIFHEKGKVVITSGDRNDMISAALDTDTSAVILTCNIEPSPELISKAQQREIPLLLVTPDTYQIAKKIDDIDPLLQADDRKKIHLLEEMVKRHVDLSVFSNS